MSRSTELWGDSCLQYRAAKLLPRRKFHPVGIQASSFPSVFDYVRLGFEKHVFCSAQKRLIGLNQGASVTGEPAVSDSSNRHQLGGGERRAVCLRCP